MFHLDDLTFYLFLRPKLRVKVVRLSVGMKSSKIVSRE
jgi:hypothetical protein